MKILYIGQYTTGTTSKMRADQLKHILSRTTLEDKEVSFDIIDTHVPFHLCHRLWRSLGFRYKRGPLIRRINNYILEQINQLQNGPTPQLNESTTQQRNSPKTHDPKPKAYTLIWIDKGIFLTPQTTAHLKSLTDKLVHFTPDMAFYSNYSNHFIISLPYYDFLISTKTAEKDHYLKYISDTKLIFTTQGYDKSIHRPSVPFNQKENAVAFIGLCEPSREAIVEQLINNTIKVKIAGKGWHNFIKKNSKNKMLSFYGEGLFSEEYTNFLSSSYFSIGLLSKNFPEYHTTRTFEIPACGTALITERNSETTAFFKDDEAIFYDTTEEIIEKIKHYTNHPGQLETLTQKGNQRVHTDGRDYESILKEVIESIGISILPH